MESLDNPPEPRPFPVAVKSIHHLSIYPPIPSRPISPNPDTTRQTFPGLL